MRIIFYIFSVIALFFGLLVFASLSLFLFGIMEMPQGEHAAFYQDRISWKNWGIALALLSITAYLIINKRRSGR